MTAAVQPDETDLALDRETELAALGAALMSRDAALTVAQIVGDGWAYPQHGTIMAACVALAEQDLDLDPTAVAHELERRGELGRVGGGPYLHTLVQRAAPSWRYHAEQVAERALLRSVGGLGQRLAQLSLSGLRGADMDDVLDAARRSLDEVAERRSPRRIHGFAQLLADTVRSLAEPAPPGIATPWPDLDELLGGGGLVPGALLVMGARPGVGKSVMAANLARIVAAGGAGVLLVSLEMPAEDIMQRILAAEAGVEFTRLRDHRLNPADWERIDRAAAAMRDNRLWIDDEAGHSLASVRAVARERSRGDGLHLVIIDYLQLMRPADTRVGRQEQVAEMARGCKLLARELEVAVVALSGINRAPAHRPNTRPGLHDLRESGELENSADQALLLHHSPDRPGELEVIVAKNRNGRTGTIHLQWAPHIQRAASLFDEGGNRR